MAFYQPQMFHVKHHYQLGTSSMRQAGTDENSFVGDLLTTLHNERFSPKAWMRFLGRSWEMSCKTASTHPTLKRSWLRVTILIAIAALVIFVASFLLEGAGTAL